MLETMVLAHLRYLEQVEQFLEGGPEPVLTPPTECTLGRWYAKEGQDTYGLLPAFQELGALHERFHALTAEAVVLRRGGRLAEAREGMNEAYGYFGKIERRLLLIAEVRG